MEITRLDPHEAAEFLGCKYDWLLKKARMGEIPHYRIGRRVFFTKEALAKWIKDQEAASIQQKNNRLDAFKF